MSDEDAPALPLKTAVARALVREWRRTGDREKAEHEASGRGSPDAHALALDLLGFDGLDAIRGLRLLDFGYGGVGSPRVLARLGFEVTGVDPSPLLASLYDRPEPSVRLVHGYFPGDPATRVAVGGDYDLVLAKNVLKRGFIAPDRPLPDDQRIRLGVEGPLFLRALHDILRPGGRVVIYNLCPSPSPPDQPYRPAADGRSPFAREAWLDAGFQLPLFDADDSAAARALAVALGWDRDDPPVDPDDLFATCTLARKPAGPP